MARIRRSERPFQADFRCPAHVVRWAALVDADRHFTVGVKFQTLCGQVIAQACTENGIHGAVRRGGDGRVCTQDPQIGGAVADIGLALNTHAQCRVQGTVIDALPITACAA